MIVAFILILLCIFASGYCFLGYMMIGSYSVTPGYPKNKAEIQAYIWLSGIVIFSILAIVLKVLILDRLVREDEFAEKK